MIKILFLIHDLGRGGAEKVLVNLVNNIDRTLFEIHVGVIFGGGINEKFLNSDIKLYSVWPRSIPGNSKWMKLFTPKQLHKMCVKEHYDIEVSYLEGVTARVISGCEDNRTKLVSWIHVEQHTLDALSQPFRNKDEAVRCYNKFHQTVCVSEFVKNDFCSILNFNKQCCVLYNTIESNKIIQESKKDTPIQIKNDKYFNMIAVGTLKKSKGYLRLLEIMKMLIDLKYDIRLYILGLGPLEKDIRAYIKANNMESNVILLGYDINPYRYVVKCDLFVCSSYSEGFSTAATESLIVGTPVCTVDVSGMKEMLGNKNQYGLVTKNDKISLFEGIKMLIDNNDLLSYYKAQSKQRAKMFSTKETVNAVERMLFNLINNDKE